MQELFCSRLFFKFSVPNGPVVLYRLNLSFGGKLGFIAIFPRDTLLYMTRRH